MITFIVIAVAVGIGAFIGGILVGRRNPKKVEKAVDEVRTFGR